jgi:hypothetical protein
MSGKSYSPSTVAVIGDIQNGLFVETAELGFAVWGTKTQIYPFKVVNRIKVLGLWAEVGTTITGACQAVFNYIQTTPSVAVAAISTVCDSMAAMAYGARASFDGITVAQKVAITAAPGISYHALGNITVILGMAPTAAGVPSIGKIGFLSSVADATVGTLRFGLLYSPIDAGAYAEALL